MKSSWLLPQLKSRQELRVLASLDNESGECYCPQIEIDKLVRDKRLKVTEPICPGYVFINTKACVNNGASPRRPHNNNHSNISIRSNRRASQNVTFGDVPVSISPILIDKLKIRDGFSSLLGKDTEAYNLLLTVDKLEVLEGSCKGLEGLYGHADGQKKSGGIN